jgi:hypothetical protein
MHVIYELTQAYPWLALLQLAFTVWMLVDASRRGVDVFWYWIIFTGIGAWAYFFVFKVRDFRGWHLPQRRESLQELRYRAEQTPTLANHLALAERLTEMKAYGGALPHLEAAQKKEAEHGQVLYLMAVCYARTDRPGQAVPFLERLTKRDPRWSGYRAWTLLIETYDREQKKPAALQSCRELVRLSPSLEHKCLLAEHLLQDGGGEEARRVLEGALEDHHFTSGPTRRRNRHWAKEARQLLKEIDVARST